VLERFDQAARRSVDLAAVEAQRLGHPHVGTEHLVLGLLAEGHNPAARLLQAAGAPLSACREKVTEALARRDLPPAPPDAADLELTDRAARAIDRAGKLSLRLKSELVSPVHLLVSVMDVEGTAGQVLRGLNVDITVLRDDLAKAATRAGIPEMAVVQGSEEPDGAQTGPEAGPDVGAALGSAGAALGSAVGADTPPQAGAEPVCTTCGQPLRATLSHTVLVSGDGVGFDVVYCSSCGASLGARPAGGIEG
jgi:ATP-dependent Clp protease ATP-binding subunit ClpA